MFFASDKGLATSRYVLVGESPGARNATLPFTEGMMSSPLTIVKAWANAKNVERSL